MINNSKLEKENWWWNYVLSFIYLFFIFATIHSECFLTVILIAQVETARHGFMCWIWKSVTKGNKSCIDGKSFCCDTSVFCNISSLSLLISAMKCELSVGFVFLCRTEGGWLERKKFFYSLFLCSKEKVRGKGLVNAQLNTFFNVFWH